MFGYFVIKKMKNKKMKKNLNAGWICGFVDGEGCFHVSVNKILSMKLKQSVLPEFVVVQHKRDIDILHEFASYFNCGYVKKNRQDRFCFIVRNTQDLLTKIIPFFDKLPAPIKDTKTNRLSKL
jgi:hypothetical protein